MFPWKHQLEILNEEFPEIFTNFNISIWKKFFQINLVSNYFGETSFLDFLCCPQFFAFIPDASVIRAKTFIDKNFSVFRELQLCRIKRFKMLLHPNDMEAIFPVKKFHYSSFFFLASDDRFPHPVHQFQHQSFLRHHASFLQRHYCQQNLKYQQPPECLVGNTVRFPSNAFQLW